MMTIVNTTLREVSGPHISFFFGRLNPPHFGHQGLIQTTITSAKNGAWAGFLSKSQDAKKNPLPYELKLRWLYTLYPETKSHIVEDPNIKTFLQAAAYLYNKGFRSATFVAGEDDMASMRPVLEQYNGKEVAHGFYKFEPLTFVESPRLTSATNAREAAKSGDADAFERATQVPSNITVDGKTLMQAVRIGLGLSETVDESLNEFAPGDNDDRFEPGFSEEMLRKLAAKWWNGNAKQMAAAQQTLYSMGWDIGEDSGYDEGGVFVIRLDDTDGESYISWSHNDLQESVSEGKVKLYTDPNYFGAEVDDSGFDSLPVKDIPISDLVGFEPDEKMAEPKAKANVKKILGGIADGSNIPPILVRKYKDGYQVLDGHHRFWAYKVANKDTIAARIVPDKDIEEVGKESVSEAAEKSTKAESKYQDMPRRGQRCDHCTMWRPPHGCSAVKGKIAANGWCSYYKRSHRKDLKESGYEEAGELLSQPVPEIQQFVKAQGWPSPIDWKNQEHIAIAKKIGAMIDAAPDTKIPAATIPTLKNLANKGNDAQALAAIQKISGRPDAAQQYIKIMQSRDTGEGRNRGYPLDELIASVKSNNYESPVLLKTNSGLVVIGGRTRLYAALALGIAAKVKVIDANNFARATESIEEDGDESYQTSVFNHLQSWFNRNEPQNKLLIQKILTATPQRVNAYYHDVLLPRIAKHDFPRVYDPNFYDMIADLVKTVKQNQPTFTAEDAEPLNELATDVLYHYTNTFGAAKILQSGEFKLANTVGSDWEAKLQPKGYPYFMSTTRSLSGGYHKYVGNSAVMFNLDGRWLNSNYKVKPVDYWNDQSTSRHRESEDRVFSREGSIPITPVVAIHVFIAEQHDFQSPEVRSIMIAAKKRGIPTYLYGSEAAWRTQNTDKSVTVLSAKNVLRGARPSRKNFPAKSYLKPYVELLLGKNRATLSSEASKILFNLRYYSIDGDDFGLRRDLSNARKPGDTDYENSRKIVSFMQQNKLKDTMDVINYIKNKWMQPAESIEEALDPNETQGWILPNRKVVYTPQEYHVGYLKSQGIAGYEEAFEKGYVRFAKATVTFFVQGLLTDLRKTYSIYAKTALQFKHIAVDIVTDAATLTNTSLDYEMPRDKAKFIKRFGPQQDEHAGSILGTVGGGAVLTDRAVAKFPWDEYMAGEPSSPKIKWLESIALNHNMIVEEILNEVKMSPTALKAAVDKIPLAKAGLEFELIVTNLEDNDDYDPYEDFDSEPDYDYDESSNADTIDQLVSQVEYFFRGDHNTRRDVNDATENLDMVYHQWLPNGFNDWARTRSTNLSTGQSTDSPYDRWLDETYGRDYEKQGELFPETPLDPYNVFYNEFFKRWSDPDNELYEGSDHIDAFLNDVVGGTAMSDIGPYLNLSWPHWTEPSESDYRGGDRGPPAADFERATGLPNKVSSGYHTTAQRPGFYKIEPDSSLRSSSGKGGEGWEFVSPALSIPEMVEQIKKVAKWAKDGNAYTNNSTGLHMNISLPGYSLQNLDYVKMALFLGDKYILEQFGRLGNSYAVSALEKIDTVVRRAPAKAKQALDLLRGNINKMASKVIHDTYTDKFTSINTKDNRIEIRSPGGDWLKMDLDKVINTMYRTVYALNIALDPQAETQEYAKKFYKLLTANQDDPNDTIKYFSQWATGQLPKTALLANVRRAQQQRIITKQDSKGDQYSILNNRSGSELHSFKSATPMRAYSYARNYVDQDSRSWSLFKLRNNVTNRETELAADFPNSNFLSTVETIGRGENEYAIVPRQDNRIELVKIRAVTPADGMDIAQQYLTSNNMSNYDVYMRAIFDNEMALYDIESRNVVYRNTIRPDLSSSDAQTITTWSIYDYRENRILIGIPEDADTSRWAREYTEREYNQGVDVSSFFIIKNNENALYRVSTGGFMGEVDRNNINRNYQLVTERGIEYFIVADSREGAMQLAQARADLRLPEGLAWRLTQEQLGTPVSNAPTADSRWKLYNWRTHRIVANYPDSQNIESNLPLATSFMRNYASENGQGYNNLLFLDGNRAGLNVNQVYNAITFERVGAVNMALGANFQYHIFFAGEPKWHFPAQSDQDARRIAAEWAETNMPRMQYYLVTIRNGHEVVLFTGIAGSQQSQGASTTSYRIVTRADGRELDTVDAQSFYSASQAARRWASEHYVDVADIAIRNPNNNAVWDLQGALINITPQQQRQYTQAEIDRGYDLSGNAIPPLLRQQAQRPITYEILINGRVVNTITARNAGEAQAVAQHWINDNHHTTAPWDIRVAASKESIEPNLGETFLAEVKMNPKSLADFAKSPVAQSMRIGFETEMYIPGVGDLEGGDPEEDMDADIDFPKYDTYRDRNETITEFFMENYENSRRTVERAIEAFENEYLDYQVQAFVDYKDTTDYNDELLDELGVKDIADASERDIENAEETIRERWNDESQEDTWKDFLSRNSIKTMHDFMSYVNRNTDVYLDWPYMTAGSNAEEILEELTDSFDRFTGFSTTYSTDYHGTTRNDTDFIFEPDGSLSSADDSDDAGVELVSPPMLLDDGLAALQKVFDWARSRDAYTNRTTGFHVGVSIPNQTMENVNHLKLILLLGDNYVLEKFNRSNNSYTKSMLDKALAATNMRDFKTKLPDILEQARQGMLDNAKQNINALLVDSSRDRFVTVNIKKTYIEFRSAGGDYIEDLDKIRETILRYVRVLAAAADPEDSKEDYYKKFYKLVTSSVKSPTSAVELFAQYVSGGIDRDTLITRLTTERAARQPVQPVGSGSITANIVDDDPEGDVINKVMGNDALEIINLAIQWCQSRGVNLNKVRLDFPFFRLLGITIDGWLSLRLIPTGNFSDNAIYQLKNSIFDSWGITNQEVRDDFNFKTFFWDNVNLQHVANALEQKRQEDKFRDPTAQEIAQMTKYDFVNASNYEVVGSVGPELDRNAVFNAAVAYANKYRARITVVQHNTNIMNVGPSEPDLHGDMRSPLLRSLGQQQIFVQRIGNANASKLFRLYGQSAEPIMEVAANSEMEAYEALIFHYRQAGGDDLAVKFIRGYNDGKYKLREMPRSANESVTPVAKPQSLPTKQTGGMHIYRNAFPDGDLILSKHYGERESERSVSYEDVVAMISAAVRNYGPKIASITDTNFIIKRREGGMGLAIQKRERPDGSQMYRLATAYPNNFRYGSDQTVFWI